MEKLITSADPLLSLAGVIFLMGLSFDVVFSSQFKDRVKETIAKSYLKDLRFSQLLAEYSRFFVSEVLSFNRISIFILKTASLSIICYFFVAIFEIKSNSFVQPRVFESVALVTPSIVFLFLFQIIFDVFSSFVSVMYIDLIARNRRPGQISILLLSDLVVSACLWGLFFSYAIALHMKIADLETRHVNLAFDIKQNPPGISLSDGFYNKNITLNGKLIISAALSRYDSDEQIFRGVGADKESSVFAITNITDDKIIFQRFLDTLTNLHEPGLSTSSKINAVQGRYYSHISVSNVIRAEEFGTILGGAARLISPLVLYFEQLGSHYFAIKKIYSWVLDSYDDHHRLGEMAVFCNDKFRTMTADEAETFSFSSCDTYFVTPKATARYVALWGGYFFSKNSVFSHGAFFWSSMAVTASFYILLLVMILIKLAKHFFSWNLLNNILNVERGFFTCIFAIPSTAILVLFAVKTLGKMSFGS